MAINLNDTNADFSINIFSNSIEKGDLKVQKTVSIPPDGSKIIAFNGHFGLENISTNDTLRISDGSTTVTYTLTHPGGGNAAGATDIGGGSDRAANLVVDEFVSKINSSALDVTATDLGGSSTSASFKITPGSGKTITVTEHPGGDGNFGGSASFTTVTDAPGSSATSSFKFVPFRLSAKGAFNLRNQSSQGSYRTFIGERKS